MKMERVMLIKVDTQIEVLNSPKNIWDYANDPKNWTASNPAEHRGLVFFNKENRPLQGTEFHQREKVAGVYADLKGHILYVDYPNLLVWSGIARYKLFGGMIMISVAEGGVLTMLNKSEATLFSHNVYMQFPDSLWGKTWHMLFTKFFHVKKAVYDHTYRELVFFKKKLDLPQS
jgi:hypothetical protein